MVIPIKVFAELISMIKSFKADIVYIKDDLIFGTDEAFYIAKRIWLDYEIPGDYIFIVNQLVEFAKNTVDLGADESVIFDPETSTIRSSYGYIKGIQSNDYIAPILKLKENAVCLLNSFSPTLIIKDLRTVEEFNRIINMKAADGSDMLIIDKYPMTIYKGFVPLNKGDRVELHIYDNNPRYFSAVFYVVKKVKYSIEIFTRYAKL